jgi:hypothetical protein
MVAYGNVGGIRSSQPLAEVASRGLLRSISILTKRPQSLAFILHGVTILRPWPGARCLFSCGCVEGSLACVGETAALHQQSWFVLVRLGSADLGRSWTDLGTAFPAGYRMTRHFRINIAHGSDELAWADWAVCRRTGTEGQSRLACGRDSRGCHACSTACSVPRVPRTYRMWTPCIAVRFKLRFIMSFVFVFF